MWQTKLQKVQWSHILPSPRYQFGSMRVSAPGILDDVLWDFGPGGLESDASIFQENSKYRRGHSRKRERGVTHNPQTWGGEAIRDHGRQEKASRIIFSILTQYMQYTLYTHTVVSQGDIQSGHKDKKRLILRTAFFKYHIMLWAV